MKTNNKLNKRSAVTAAIFDALESRSMMAATPALDYSGYFGSTGSDVGTAITVDSAGNTYVAGSTTSASGVAIGGHDTTYSGGSFSGDAIVAKFAPSGQLVWSSYLGNSGGLEEANAIALDSAGNVYVAGQSSSSGWTAGGYDSSLGGGADGFVAKFNNAGQLAWSTYVGGAQDDQVFDMHVTGKGVVTIVGQTFSADLPGGGFDSTANGALDGFVTRLNTKGGLISSSYIGAAGNDSANGVAMGIDGSIFVVGETASASGIVSGGPDTSYGGFTDGFVMQIKPDGTKGWSTYLGGNDFDSAQAIAIAADGQLIIGGDTNSANFAGGGYDTTFAGSDCFVLRMTPAGQTVWSTYVGGSGLENLKDVTIGADGTIGVVGGTGGGTWVSKGPVTTYNGGVADGFAVQLSSAGQHKWSTFVGGDDTEYTFDAVFDSQNRMLITGFTGSGGWTSGGVDTSYGGNADVFIARYSFTEPFVSAADGIATITGTDDGDIITVSTGGGKLNVNRNGSTQSVPSAGITRIEVFAGGGNDNVTIGAAVPATYIDAGSGNDNLQGGDGNDTLTGGAGKNTMFGGNGNDRINGSGGRDFLYGQAGDDRLYGNGGDDDLDGGGNVDCCFGGDGNDQLIGGSSNDKLYGEAGDDMFTGGNGADLLVGDAGADTAVNDPTDTRLTIETLV